ncbi:MAG: hypothetical protein ABW032_03185 [Burkholderiaceae bacterium]
MADKLVHKLNDLGYQPVFLPRAGVAPAELWVYQRDARGDSKLVRMGALSKALPAAAALEIRHGQLGDIEAHYTSQKKLGAAVGFLKDALKCIGISAVPKIDLGFTGATDFSFSFTGVRYRAVDPVDLFPIVHEIRTEGFPAEYIDDGLLHIVYEFAYADELLLSRGDKQSFEADISGKVGHYFDLGGKGSVAMAGKAAISFKGAADAQAAFAYKAGRLLRENGRWTFQPEVVLRRGLVEERRPFLPQPAVPLRVIDHDV